MKTTVKKLSDTRVELKVVLDTKDLASARQKALEKLAKEVQVEGFRKGKVPTDVAARFIPENDLNSTTIDYAVRTTVFAAFSKHEKSPLAVPEINVTKYVPNELAEYTATADILPEIKLADYRNLQVKRETAKVSSQDITEVLNNIARSFSAKTIVKRPAQASDEVIIDFVGKKDDKPFEGGSAKDYALVLGSNSFIPGFEDGIIGRQTGDKFDLKLTFPKDYGVKALAGQKTVFEVLLKQVSELKPAKLDDELAKKCGPFKNLDELKTDIEKNLSAQNNHKLTEKYKDDLVAALVKKSQISAPEILIKDQLRFIKDDLERNAASQNLSFEEYLKQAGETSDSWETSARKVAEARVKASLALQILARDQKITVSDDQVAAKIAELKDVYQKSPEALKNLKDPNVKMDIKNRLTIEKTLDFLVTANETTKKSPKKP